MEGPLIYRSYLLRLWQVREAGQLAWRATLEDVKTGERRGFANLEDLIAFFHEVKRQKPTNREDSQD